MALASAGLNPPIRGTYHMKRIWEELRPSTLLPRWCAKAVAAEWAGQLYI